LTIISVPAGFRPYRAMSGAMFNAAAKFQRNRSLNVRSFEAILWRTLEGYELFCTTLHRRRINGISALRRCNSPSKSVKGRYTYQPLVTQSFRLKLPVRLLYEIVHYQRYWKQPVTRNIYWQKGE